MPISLPPSPMPIVSGARQPGSGRGRPVRGAAGLRRLRRRCASRNISSSGRFHCGHRDAAHVQVVAGRGRGPAARWRPGGVGRSRASTSAAASAPSGYAKTSGGSPSARSAAFERRQRRGVAGVPDPGAQPAQRPAQHGGARRSIGLRHALGDDEAGDDQHASRAPVSARAAASGAARPEEPRDAAAAGIESEQMVDRVSADAGGAHGSGRYHTRRLTSYRTAW